MQFLAQQAAAAAHAAGASIVAGLRTCDERNAALASQFEISIERPGGEKEQKPDDNNGSLSVWSGPLGEPQKPRIWGNPSFNFDVTVGSSFSSQKRPGRISVKATAGPRGEPVEVRCRWIRKFAENVAVTIPGHIGTFYDISADDASACIVVEVQPTASAHSGVAFAEVGPFNLDAATRRHLGDYLALRAARFPLSSVVDVSSATSGLIPVIESSENDMSPDWTLIVKEDSIRVMKPLGGVESLGSNDDDESYAYGEQWSCRYGSTFPILTLDRHNDRALTLKLGHDQQLRVQALTRTQRDLLALTVRCFFGRHWVITSALIRAVGLRASREMTGDNTAPGAADQALPLDLLVSVQALTGQLQQSLELQEKYLRERNRVSTEKNALEIDIETTLQAYQGLLAQAETGTVLSHQQQQQQLNLAKELKDRAAYTANLETQLRDAQATTTKQMERIQLLTRDHRELSSRFDSTINKLRTLERTYGGIIEHTDSHGAGMWTRQSLPDGFADTKDRTSTGTTATEEGFRTSAMKDSGIDSKLFTVNQRHKMLSTKASTSGRTDEAEELKQMRTKLPLATWNETAGSAGFSANAELTNVRQQLENVRRELEETVVARQDTEAKYLYIRQKFEDAKLELERLRRQSTLLTTQDTTMFNGTATVTPQHHNTNANTFHHELKLRDLENEISLLRTKHTSITKEKSLLSEENAKLNEEINNLKNEIAQQLASKEHLVQTLVDKGSTTQTQMVLEEENIRLRKLCYDKDIKIKTLQNENEQLRRKIRTLATDS